jgi:hypothetical protein
VLGFTSTLGQVRVATRYAWLFLLTFFTFCYFLLLFLLLVKFGNYFLLSKGVRFVTFSTFFFASDYDKLLFTGPRGPGFMFYSLWDGGEKVHLHFFSFIF